MITRQEKIRLLTRANRGRAAIPSFITALSDALGERIEAQSLIPLRDTDVLLATFQNGYRAAMAPGAISYRKFFLLKEEGFVFLLASCLAEKLFNENGFLLTKLSEYCGAVDVNVSTLLKHAESVIRFDGDSVCVLSKHCHEGLMIDHNLDDHEQAYEVAIWGKRWPLKALACV